MAPRHASRRVANIGHDRSAECRSLSRCYVALHYRALVRFTQAPWQSLRNLLLARGPQWLSQIRAAGSDLLPSTEGLPFPAQAHSIRTQHDNVESALDWLGDRRPAHRQRGSLSFGLTNSLFGMVNLRMPSWCRVLVLGFILSDEFPGLGRRLSPARECRFRGCPTDRLGPLRPIGKRCPRPEGPF